MEHSEAVKTAFKNKDPMSFKLEYQNLSIKAYHGLKRRGIDSLLEIRSIAQLENTRGLGAKFVQEIVECCEKNGITLPQNDE